MGFPLSSRKGALRDTCWLRIAGPRRGALAMSLASIVALAALLAPGCKHLRLVDTRPLDLAGMGYRGVEELRELDVTDAEVAALVKAREAGISDVSCVELVRIARGRKQPFSSGEAIASLQRVGVSESTVLELARLDQLGLWVGEAQAMRLAGLSDQVLLGVARRRAAGQPALSGSVLVRLKDAGLSETKMIELIERGTTDKQAEEMLAAWRRAAGRSHFVRYPRRRRTPS